MTIDNWATSNLAEICVGFYRKSLIIHFLIIWKWNIDLG
ncbi:unnamed protein product [Paramecium octaurelia]|uniref:Uncharacterized protein n=1 Tax=Paramecium octaurelia TaxID=43137 RepID=A0A8S1TSW7_PAROT|nr:unnamed protein product [Paramecium octaurelia]